MGCGSSKTLETGTVTKTILIIPRDSTPNGDELLTKTADLPHYSRSVSNPRTTTNTPDLSTKHSKAPLRSPGTATLNMRKKGLSAERNKASSSSVICVEPLKTPLSSDARRLPQRQLSASSHVTADSGYGEESRTGVSAESARTGGVEGIAGFNTDHSLSSAVDMVLDSERPVPDLLIEGISCLPPLKRTTTFSKLTNLPGALDKVHPASTENILEKAPLPPIHSQTKRPRVNLFREESHPPTMELEQDLDIVSRPSSRGGMAFDIILGLPTSKRQALTPIEFNSEKFPGKKEARKRHSTDKLTKESIAAKLEAADKKKKQIEEEIVKNLIEKREVGERKMKELNERSKEEMLNKEANLDERMRTTSVNRDVQISAKVSNAQRVKEKLENARQARKQIPLKPEDRTTN